MCIRDQYVIAETIYACNRVAHSDPVEQRTPRELQILPSIAENGFECVHAKQRVVVLVIESRSLLANDAAVQSAESRADAAEITKWRTQYVSIQCVVDRIETARHVQNASQRDPGPRVG